MASVVEICNMALADVGDIFIESLADTSKEARRCSVAYNPARRGLLRAFDWNFARARVELAPLVAAPAFGFSAAFQLPSECMRVLSVVGDPEWTVEGRTILAAGDALQIIYTRDVTDPNQFDALFIRALATRLAADIAYSLAPSKELVQNLEAKHAMAVTLAQRVGAIESDWKTKTAAMDSNDWTTARS
jgi:hypothetical protein